MSEPAQTVLTPAQVELLEEMLEAREAKLIAYINDSIANAFAHAVTYGGRIALRTSHGVLVCVVEGGPYETEQPIRLESRQSIGPWESFTVERGQA
jgi:predicted ATP-grasp superfamily ATP-dependent carboligase